MEEGSLRCDANVSIRPAGEATFAMEGGASKVVPLCHQVRLADPVLELRVFRSRDFTLAILTQWAGFGAMFGSFFLVPLFLQQVRGYGSFETGLFTLPQAVASAIFMQISGRAFDRFGTIRSVSLH